MKVFLQCIDKNCCNCFVFNCDAKHSGILQGSSHVRCYLFIRLTLNMFICFTSRRHVLKNRTSFFLLTLLSKKVLSNKPFHLIDWFKRHSKSLTRKNYEQLFQSAKTNFGNIVILKVVKDKLAPNFSHEFFTMESNACGYLICLMNYLWYKTRNDLEI